VVLFNKIGQIIEVKQHMHVKTLTLFEDDVQPNQQIVINNPGTVVIQSPTTAGNIPQFNDDVPSPNEEILNTPTVYPQFDGENNLQLDPNFKKLNNPSPNMNNNIPVADPTIQNGTPPVFNDDLPNKDQSLNNQPIDNSVAGIPQTQPFFNDDPNAVQNQVVQDTNTQVPQMQQAPQQIDPNIQQPVFNDDPNAMPAVPPQGDVAPQIDPTTGQPMVDPSMAMQPQIDPMTGMPIDPMAGMTDTFSDDVVPQANVGNSSEVKIGAAVPLEDLSRINELKKINSQLMRIRGILERELNKKYNPVEDKLNEAIEYFRTIISNLDSFTTQVDDIIFKYKRFILTILTQINILKKEELDGTDGKKKKDTEKTKTDSDKKDTK
jgi:hypothetical protein